MLQALQGQVLHQGKLHPRVVRGSDRRCLTECKSFNPSAKHRALAGSSQELQWSRLVPHKVTKRSASNGSRVSLIAKGLGDLLKGVTGGSAKLEILIDEPANGLATPSVSQPFNVIVIAEASQKVKYRKVYFKVNCAEELTNYSINISEPEYSGSLYINDSSTTVSLEIDMAESGILLPGEQVQWEIQVVLPPGSAPSFKGRNIANVWKVQAGIGTGIGGGINPSTGWKPIFVGP